jgi:hypothetical protein
METPARSASWALSRGVPPTAVVLGALIAVLAALPVSFAQGVSPSTSTLAPGYWAFGAQRSINATGTAIDGNTTYTLHASFGWNTVLRQINGTGGNFEVVGNRTVGASLFVDYCRPQCSGASRSLNITERLWETQLTFAHFTSSGTVYSGGQPVSALALLDSSVRSRGNLTESATALIRGPAGHTYTASQGLSLATSANVAVDFQPALGLIPIDLNVSSWNSSARYSASGSWSVALGVDSTSFSGRRASSSQSYPGSFTGVSGAVALVASTAGNLTLKDGESADQVGITITGPFVSWDGFILVPDAAELLDQSAPPWAGDQAGQQSASTARLDVGRLAHLGHLPVVASMASYLPGASDAASPSLDSGISTALTGSPGTGGVSGPLDGPAPTAIQGQPETPAAANASSQCLITGCTSPGSPSIARGLLLVLLGLVVAAIVAAVVIVQRQPPRKAPSSPNAALYPPLPAGTAPKRAPAAPGGPPSPDPLGHLW